MTGLTQALGLKSALPRGRALVEIIRLIYAAPDSSRQSEEARRTRLRNYLETVSRAQADTVPLPLPAEVWAEAVLRRPVDGAHLAGAILSNRNAALLYHGLAALDPVTLAFLAGHPDVVARLREDGAPVFATCGRSLQISNDRIVTPGPPVATSLWEWMVGERAERPDRFVTRLFSADEGRLALFYDLVAHLDERAQRYVLGTRIGSTDGQRAQLRALYAAFVAQLRAWRPTDRPFMRVAYDAGQLLLSIAVTPEGAFAPPAWSRLWAAVFADTAHADPAAGSPRPGELGEPLSAAALIELMGGIDVNLRRERMETLLFAQRVFGSADATEASDILVALRGFVRFRALMLTLERMGLTEPALMARAARHADRISSLINPADSAVLIAQFQGAVGIVERARYARVLDVKTAADLVDALIGFAPLLPTYYARQMAQWLDGRLVPALREGTGTGSAAVSRELLVLMAMAGAREAPAAGREAGPFVRWEDHDYRVDLAASELKRLQRIRARQPSNDLDAVLDFARAIEPLGARVPHAEQLPPILEGVRAAATPLRPPVRVGMPQEKPGPDPGDLVASVLRDAARIKDDGDLAGLGRVTAPLFEHLAVQLSEVLATLAYLPSLGDPEGPTLLAGNVAARHDFGFAGAGTPMDPRVPWNMASEKSGTGIPWHMEGSLLGLDAALAHLALRQIAAERVPGVPALDMNERATLAATVVLTNPWDLDEARLSLVVGAIKAGRHRVAEAQSGDPGRLVELLANAGVDEWRIRAVTWMAAREPREVPGMLSLADLFWMGAGREAQAADLAAFGPGPAAIGACLCTEFPAPGPWDAATGREGAGFLTARFDDLKLRIVEGLADLKLPVTLLAGVLAVATSDFIDEAAPVHRNDWVTLAGQAQQIPKARFEDYVATLTASGPLVPANSGRKLP